MRIMPMVWYAAPSEQGEHGEEGIELMMQTTPHNGSPKIPAAYSVVDVAPSESGYETDATAFSEGAFSDDDDDLDQGENERNGLLTHHHASGDHILFLTRSSCQEARSKSQVTTSRGLRSGEPKCFACNGTAAACMRACCEREDQPAQGL